MARLLEPEEIVYGDYALVYSQEEPEKPVDVNLQLAGAMCGFMLGLFGLLRILELLAVNGFHAPIVGKQGRFYSVFPPMVALGSISLLFVLSSPWFSKIFLGSGDTRGIRLPVAAVSCYVLLIGIIPFVVNKMGLLPVGYFSSIFGFVADPERAAVWGIFGPIGVLALNRFAPRILRFLPSISEQLGFGSTK